MKVYVNEYPRSLALATEDYVLILRYSLANNQPKCIVEFTARNAIDFDNYVLLSTHDCFGTLGLIMIDGDAFMCTVTRKSEVATPRPGESINRIYAVDFHCLNRPDWDFVSLDANGYPLDVPINNGLEESKAHSNVEHPCASIRKLLSNGSFYYSTNFDLTNVLQNRGTGKQSLNIDTIDQAFMWNSYMIENLIKFRARLRPDEIEAIDKCGFLTSAIRGFAHSASIKLGGERLAVLSIISRQSCRRAGTRYNARGIDDEGNVANFVETETVLYTDDVCFAYAQIRGSVPLFWEQDANILGAKINITRSAEAAQPAFNKHVESLTQKFGNVHIIDLLSTKSGEAELSERYHHHIAASPKELKPNLGLTAFDFHAEVAKAGYSSASRIVSRIREALQEFGFYSSHQDSAADDMEQIGIFRTNCLDCLDRTNMIQQIISKEALEIFFDYNHIYPGPEIWAKHNFLWADNGDQLSQIYAGTNALKTSYTRSGKMGLAGAIADVTKSVGRMYINNFVDKGRQNTMDFLLGNVAGQIRLELYDPINDFVIAELARRRNEFSSNRDIRIFAGTFNLGGVLSDAQLDPWLFPNTDSDIANNILPDLYLVGFQEIVELTPGQILNADPGKREFWEKRVSHCLNQHDEYVLLRSGQLVGTALLLFVKKSEVQYITKVEGSMKKTGLGGMAGNKGGVAVSFHYADTTFCFITAHLAAGMNNIDERHNDYKTISSGLRFSRGRRVKDHDTVIWLGDFNYRISLPAETVKAQIEKGDLGSIFEHDQLNLQMVKGETFPYYNEMEIKFPPTYKFDNESDIYDTSEKARTPSWTDRILSRGINLRQLTYGSASQLKFSDHRPVYGSFKATILMVDNDTREKLRKQLYDKRRQEVGDANDIISSIELNVTTMTHGLPPPSTDSKKWWIAGGQPVKVPINPPRPNMVLNPRKPVNPFNFMDDDDDFIDKPKLPPRPQTFAGSSALPHKPRPTVPRKPPELSAKNITRDRSNSGSVPRKPVGSNDDISGGFTGFAGHPGLGHGKSGLPMRTVSVPPEDDRSSDHSIRSTSSVRSTPQLSSHQAAPPPPLPPRSRASTLDSPLLPEKSLLDEINDSEGMAKWEPLKPQ